jgi:drug/metabolite transporter (DMT)-like permease
MDLKLLGMGAALGSAASWAIGSILFKRIGETVTPFGMTLSKGAVSLLLLGAVLFATGCGDLPGGALGLLLLSGILGIAVGDTLFFAALQDLGPIGLIVFFMAGQILTALMAILFLGEMPGPGEWTGIAVVLAGIAMVLITQISRDDSQRPTRLRGIMLGFFSMLAMSLSLIIAKPALASVSTMTATFIRMAAGTLGMLLFGLLTGRVREWLNPFSDTNMIAGFVLSVCVVTFGGFWLSLVAIKHVEIAIANALGAAEPLFVIPLAVVFLKERVTLMEIAGAVITVFGVVLLCRV